MTLRKFLFLISLLSIKLVSAQEKTITLEEIWNGSFRTEGLQSLHPLKDGESYSVLNFNKALRSTSIDVYDYKASKYLTTILSSNNLNEVSYFLDYTFSNDESKILIATSEQPLYRHSKLGLYYIYDVSTKTLIQLSEEYVQEPSFSPDGSKVAYVLKNNIYVKDLNKNVTYQITNDGKLNHVINGVTDWVYEEEFAFVRAFEWNSSGDQIAYIKFDETNVPEFSMDIYGEDLYPFYSEFKYPKAGEINAKVSLHVFNSNTKKTKEIKVDNKEQDFYIPRIKWTNANNLLTAQFLNRQQNDLNLWLIDTKTNNSSVLLNEKDNAYIDITFNLTFLKDNSFIWTSEKDGFNHIYHYNIDGSLNQQVTSGKWEVTAYYGFSTKQKKIFYQSTEEGSINRTVYSIGLNGKNKKKLTSSQGTNEASFSADYSFFINTFSNVSTPPQYTLISSRNAAVHRNIKDNSFLKNKISTYKWSVKTFSTTEINGYDLNYWMIKPHNFDPSKSYPLLMYQYSGPGSQKVANQWNDSNDYWHQYLASKGYVIVCVDGRGTGFKGAQFKKLTQNQLGKFEVEDQVEAARKFGELSYIDASKIGIWGWSYGGFMSSNAILKGSDVFKAAIAVAPVTSWRFYDTIYTERYMDTPQNNPSGYDDNSPLSHVYKLKGKYLLIHGSADDNVHVQNTMRMVEALIQANKQFEWMIYPDKNHGIYGGNTRLHLYNKMTNFLNDNLKN